MSLLTHKPTSSSARVRLALFASYPYRPLDPNGTSQREVADSYPNFREQKLLRTDPKYQKDPQLNRYLEGYQLRYGEGGDTPRAAERAYLIQQGRDRTYTYTPERRKALDSSIDTLRSNRDIKNALGTVRRHGAYRRMTEAERAKLSPREAAMLQNITDDDLAEAVKVLQANPDRLNATQSAYKKISTLSESAGSTKRNFLPGRTTERTGRNRQPVPSVYGSPNKSLTVAGMLASRDSEGLEGTKGLLVGSGAATPDGSAKLKGVSRQFIDNEVVRREIQGIKTPLFDEGAAKQLNTVLSTSSPASPSKEVLDKLDQLKQVGQGTYTPPPGSNVTAIPGNRLPAKDPTDNVPLNDLGKGSKPSTRTPTSRPLTGKETHIYHHSSPSYNNDVGLYRQKRDVDVEAATRISKVRDRARMRGTILTGGILAGTGLGLIGANALYDRHRRRKEQQEFEKFRQEIEAQRK